MHVVLNTQSLPADIQRLRREYESKRLAQIKRIRESIKKIAKEERETWFPPPKKTEEPDE